MDDLTMDLVRLTRHNKDGSHSTQNNRKKGVTAIARELDTLGYKLPSARSIKPKHINALVEHWKGNDLNYGTMRNRLAWLRWWAEKVDKASIVARDNADYDIIDKTKVIQNRAQRLDPHQHADIDCPRIKASILLQVHFGLRREEAIKFQPRLGIREEHVYLQASWTKGGRSRVIPIQSDLQRQILKHIQTVVKGDEALIPADKTYAQQLKSYEYQTLKVGMRNTHGFRYRYAQERYHALTEKLCPAAGGKCWHEMNDKEKLADREARRQVSQELGHTRLAITDKYLGRATS